MSRGEIHLTDDHLFYFRPGKFPIQWPIRYIRRYGCNESGEIFSFETGRQSTTGQAIYAFHLANAQDLVNRLKEKIEKNANSLSNENRTANNNHNRSSFKFNRSCFSSGTDQPTIEYDCLENQNDRPRSSNPNTTHSKRCHTDNPTGHPTSTYSDIQSLPIVSPTSPRPLNEDIDLKPLPYSNINADVTQSLNALAKDHAENRQR